MPFISPVPDRSSIAARRLGLLALLSTPLLVAGCNTAELLQNLRPESYYARRSSTRNSVISARKVFACAIMVLPAGTRKPLPA